MKELPVMGRARTRLQLTPSESAELNRLLGSTRDIRARERLRFAQRASVGRHTLEELARLAGRSRSTIQNWLGKFESGGLAGLLARDTPPGMISPLATMGIQAQLRAGLKSRRWKSAAEVAAWLKEKHGIDRARKSIYYWMRKHQIQSGKRRPRGGTPVVEAQPSSTKTLGGRG